MSDDIGFQLIKPTDFDAIDRLAGNLAKPRIVEWFWEDSLRVNPVHSFTWLFMTADNVVIDVGPGHGAAAFINVNVGWKAYLYVALWGTKAFRKPELWRKILAVVMEMKDLIIVEALTRDDNILANRALERCGFRHRGSIPHRLCYNGVWHSAEWWEIDRKAVGLPERT